MNKILAVLMASLFATVSFAQAPAAPGAKPMEAQKSSDAKPEAKAQAKTDAKPMKTVKKMKKAKKVKSEPVKAG